MNPEKGVAVYFHFPWCVRKCPYCDFNSHPLKDELPADAYTGALIRDLDQQLNRYRIRRIDTIFCGGGTPSLFPPVAFARLLDHLAGFLTADAEITMEANPGTMEHGDLAGYRLAGINRLSLGAQSFDDARLAALGRIHDSASIRRSFRLARQAGFTNINLDLMYGLPEQNRQQAMADLDQALALSPEHLSWYQLTLEPKTEFARRPPPLPSDIMLAATEDAGYEKLLGAGFSRYEVSAFARPGHGCEHNLRYWTFADYLGIGAGAHGKLSLKRPENIVRTRKAPQPRRYLAAPEETMEAAVPVDALPGEFMLNVLRLTDGVAAETFETATGLPLDRLQPVRDEQTAAGLLSPHRLATSSRGYAVLDSLIQAYL